MNVKLKNTPPTWSDPDDAPELTDADFARGTWRIGKKVVTRDAAQAAQVRRGRPPGSVKAERFQQYSARHTGEGRCPGGRCTGSRPSVTPAQAGAGRRKCFGP